MLGDLNISTYLDPEPVLQREPGMGGKTSLIWNGERGDCGGVVRMESWWGSGRGDLEANDLEIRSCSCWNAFGCHQKTVDGR